MNKFYIIRNQDFGYWSGTSFKGWLFVLKFSSREKAENNLKYAYKYNEDGGFLEIVEIYGDKW